MPYLDEETQDGYDGYAEDVLTEEADKYEEELKLSNTDYLRVDL